MWKLSAEKPEKTSAKNGYRMGIKWVYKIPSPKKEYFLIKSCGYGDFIKELLAIALAHKHRKMAWIFMVSLLVTK